MIITVTVSADEVKMAVRELAGGVVDLQTTTDSGAVTINVDGSASVEFYTLI